MATIRIDTSLKQELFDYDPVIAYTQQKVLKLQVIKGAIPLNIAGWTIEQHIKTAWNGASVKIYTIGDGITVTDAANGKYEIDAHIINIKGGNYIHETLLIDPSVSKPYRWMRGSRPIENHIV